MCIGILRHVDINIGHVIELALRFILTEFILAISNLFLFFFLQKIFVPVIRFVEDLVAVHKDNWLILDTLPSIYDSRVKVLQGDETNRRVQ